MTVAGRSSTAGIAYVALTAAAYAAMDVSAKLAYDSGLNVATMLTLRFVGAGLMLVVLGVVLRLRPRPTFRQMVGLIALGAFAYAAESFMLNSAFRAMAVGPAILVFHTYPSIVAVIAFVLGREIITGFKLSSLALSFLGVSMLVAFPVGGMSGAGVLLAFGAAIAFATYTLVAENAIAHAHKVLLSGWVLLGAGMSIGLFGVGFGAVHLDIGAESWRWVGLHVVLIGVAVVAFTGSIAALGATRAAIGGTLQPAVTVVFAAIILDERLGALQIVGIITLLVAIGLLPLGARQGNRHIDVAVLD